MSHFSSLDPTKVPDCTGEINEPAGDCNQEFTHQIKLIPVLNETVPTNNVPWSVHFEGQEYNARGETNSEGKTNRVKTPRPEKFFGLVGKLAEGYRKRGNDFGTLKEVDERQISLVTSPDYTTKEIPYCSGYDYIAVVGARTAPRDWRWQGLWGMTSESKGNQYRFVNCGIRQLRDFPTSSPDDYTLQRIIIVFQSGYTENDIKVINDYVTKLNARVIYVKNKNDLISFLQERKNKKRLIKEMVFFCHGIINIASFHYAGEDETLGEFSSVDIKKIYESIFDYDAKVTTYACRAGISKDGSDFTGKDPGQKFSPAQNMADAWDIRVRAFEMRSSYVGVYGTSEEIQLAKNYSNTVKRHEEEIAIYEESIRKGDKNAKPPKKPDEYEENIRRNEDVHQRAENEKKGGPISPNGSWRYPGTGNTPVGLKKGLQTYFPLEWELQ